MQKDKELNEKLKVLREDYEKQNAAMSSINREQSRLQYENQRL